MLDGLRALLPGPYAFVYNWSYDKVSPIPPWDRNAERTLG